jgi:hypothetical protein
MAANLMKRALSFPESRLFIPAKGNGADFLSKVLNFGT